MNHYRKTKLLMLADPNPSHTIKWASSLSARNVDVRIFSLTEYDESNYKNYPEIKITSLGLSIDIQQNGVNAFDKYVYLKAVPIVKKIVEDFKPDILHAHYASSYGLLGALTFFQPYIISVWGTDVLQFPYDSFINSSILKFNFKRAKEILATGKYLAEETSRFSNKKVTITPFGVDTNIFKPMQKKNEFEDFLVIGVIRRLEENYGIERLIRAFKLVLEKFPDKKLKLLIVGDGSLKNHLINLTHELLISDDVVFTGYIEYEKIVEYHNSCDISVVPSIRESFGVSALEASACGKPVIVTNAGGLPETVIDGSTGLIVEKDNIKQLASALEKLIIDEQLRKTFGENGREMVKQKYEWNNCVELMLNIYNNILKNGDINC